MPSTGTPSSNTACGALSVASSYADMWLPDRITPFGANARTKSSLTSAGWISQYTLASRTRRAISCVTCEPKSRIRILSWFIAHCAGRTGVSKRQGPPHDGRRARKDSSRRPSGLQPIVRRLFGDPHVVHMRLAHAGGGDLDELRLRAHLVDRPAPAVAHP